MTLRHQLDSLLLYDPDRAAATVNVWVAHPTPSEEQTFGTLFVVSAIEQANRLNHDILNILQEELKLQYYQSAPGTIDTIFETALQKTNQRLHRLIIEGVGQWVDRAHILVGVLWHQRLLLTTLGAIHAYLIRRERIHDVLGQPTATKPNPLRLFDQVVSGTMEAGDRLLFCTPSLLDYFSLEKLRRTLLDHQPNQAVRALETTLLGTEHRLAFAALVVALEATAETAPITALKAPAPYNRPTPQISMDQLRHRERATEKLLAPSMWPAFRDIGQQVWTGTRQQFRRLGGRPAKRTLAWASTTPTPQPPTPNQFWVKMKTVLAGWRPAWPRIQLPFRRTAKATPPAAPGFHRPRNPIEQVVIWIQGLPRPRQLIFAGILVATVVFATSLVQTNRLGGRSTSATSSNASVMRVTSALDQANAALLYGGEDTARQKLAEAESGLAGLPNRSKSDKQQRANFQTRIASLQQRLAHLTVLTDPPVVTHYSDSSPAHPTQLYQIGDQLAAFDPSSSTLLLTTPTDGKTANASANTLDTGKPLTGTVINNDIILFATDRDGFLAYSLSKKTWRPVDSTFPKSDPAVQFLSFFQNRVYALDRTHQSIVRFSYSANAIGTGVNWLQEPAHLQSARAAVVDGSIFVLQPNGVVEEYFGGKKRPFSLTAISPTLSNPTRLWTSEGSRYLYLLEPATKRLVVFTKEGKLVDQYQASQWSDLRDMVADEANRVAYLVAGTTLYRINLLH